MLIIKRRLNKISLMVSMLALIALLYGVVSVWVESAGAQGTQTPFPSATGFVKLGNYPRLCGELVYLQDTKTGYKTIGLKPCGSQKPLIFHTKPRDLVQYYQFRDAVLERGKTICDPNYGCLSTYISTFKNYVGLENCRECGVRYLPTWTLAPLTPYTPTSPPPSETPEPPTATPTFTMTPLPVTDTPELSDVLFGSETALANPMPTAGISVTPVAPVGLELTLTPLASLPISERGKIWPYLLAGFVILFAAVLLAFWSLNRFGGGPEA